MVVRLPDHSGAASPPASADGGEGSADGGGIGPAACHGRFLPFPDDGTASAPPPRDRGNAEEAESCRDFPASPNGVPLVPCVSYARGVAIAAPRSPGPGCTSDKGGRAIERLFVSLPGEPGPGPETGTGPDCIRALAVPGDLCRVVGQAMIYRETIPADATVRERVLPDGAVRIVANLSADQDSCLRVLGPATAPESVPLRGSMKGLSLTLRPEAARAVLGLPVGRGAGLDLPLTELWAGEAACLASRLGEAEEDSALTEILWTALRRRLARASTDLLPVNLSRLIGDGGARRPGQPARRRDIGERRMQQLYREHIGLSPRAARRLARWHGLLRALRRVDRPDWAALSVEHGWYDQAHLCRDFRVYSGLSPSGYFARAFSRSSKTTEASAG